ncbi:MAG: helix-turn-helix domain-containing protein [Gammaproteobacteria bacterium SHHR-1]|uniref:helix-turn-helix domain-containing protein n=1 Tax=Magnetovirga frankeli TaxID=947516 RepID=UPI0012934ED8|nr:helix-turn-helix domain-containing protein [gamma proteobacterium SS-5]
MFWTSIARLLTALHLTYALKNLTDQGRRERCEINPNRIYNSKEVARLLEMERRDVLRLITQGALKARLVNGNYRVSGQCILEYLKNEV